MSSSISFIGGGNMAAALIGGLLAAGHERALIRVAEPGDERAQWLRDQYGIAVSSTAAAAVKDARTVVLAVKPQQMAQALAGLQLDEATTVVSIAAGVRLASLRKWLGPRVHLVRTMPNTPALYRKGITGLYTDADTPESARRRAETVLKAAGEICWLKSESDLDAVTALSGSGPAYYFLLTEVLREAGEKLGLERDVAARLAQQTFIGSAEMAARSGQDVRELRTQVTSRGGTTEAALQSLESADIRGIFARALSAAASRGKALGDDMEKTA
ncbi:MAG TPA: pyrroline-5-carboxylate reductase [Stenotrophobium sp.]|jgi:pyrroline-5-carboxylate reductase|nr:pyrroline-5-carboxylate reductase [Stenotrophobium sp.]